MDHAQKNIDQVFPRTSPCLRADDAATHSVLHKKLHSTHNDITKVAAVTSVANISELFETKSCPCHGRYLPAFSIWLYLHRFCNENGLVRCKVKYSTKSDCIWWQLDNIALLARIPRLSARLPTIVQCPDNAMDGVTNVSNFEKSRITSPAKIVELFVRRCRMFKAVREVFAWTYDGVKLPGLLPVPEAKTNDEGHITFV